MIEDNEFYWTLLDTLKDGVYFADRKRKVTYWNKAAEAISGYRSGEILGIHCSDNILVHIDEEGNNLCTGECPLARSMETGKSYEKKIFLHHKDGHRVPVLVRVSPVYGPDRSEIVGAVEIFTDLSGKIPFLEDIREREHESFLNHLTGLPSRNYLEASLNLKLTALNDYGHPFGVYLIKVGGLSHVKRKHGLEVYEKILKTLSNTLIHNVGASEIVGEWSEDEFLGIVSHGNAEKLSRKVDSYRVLLEKSHYSSPVFPVSLTFSVHTFVPGTADTLETIIDKTKTGN